MSKLLTSTYLSRTSIFYIHHLPEIPIFNDNKNPKFAAFEVVKPSLKSLKNGYKLIIISFLFCIYINDSSIEKSYQVLFTNFPGRIRRSNLDLCP